MTVTVRMMGGLRLTWDLLNAFNADPAQHGPALASAWGVMRNVQAIYKHTNDAGAVNNGVIGLQWTHLSGPFSNLVPAEKIVEFLVRYFSDNNGLSVIHEVVPDPFSVGGPVHQGPIKRTSLEAREEQCTIHDFVSLFNNGVLWFPDDPFYGVAC
ncbi:hypothetical protein M011DRAFT_461738 [Sporormia fimetaria CBS 119925]|uniref:Uncharacterized protein n=1 Tax=Sporormia fimetaria CBS 119925 TaxID=1340428 RepID=A0A6A6V0P6_9PLEO|nr:hypothetical protein M011DRAFT_461738 [Sporormia fimetaria CBS 119925]